MSGVRRLDSMKAILSIRFCPVSLGLCRSVLSMMVALASTKAVSQPILWFIIARKLQKSIDTARRPARSAAAASASCRAEIVFLLSSST